MNHTTIAWFLYIPVDPGDDVLKSLVEVTKIKNDQVIIKSLLGFVVENASKYYNVMSQCFDLVAISVHNPRKS